MIEDRRPRATVIGGGYNYSYYNELITESYPRSRTQYLKFVAEDTDIRCYFDYPHTEHDPCLKPAKVAIAVAEEPYVIVPEFSHFIYHHGKMFDAVFASDPNILSMTHLPNIRYFPGAGTCIERQHWGLPEKSQMVCGIFSIKAFSEGHKLRQQVRASETIQRHPCITFLNSPQYRTDSYNDKGVLIRPYRYNIAIESTFNSTCADKIVDCFLTGTIPIYKGTDRVRDYFNVDGVLLFNTIAELDAILSMLDNDGEAFYEQRMDAVRENFARALHHVDMSEVLWNHGLREILERKGLQ